MVQEVGLLGLLIAKPTPHGKAVQVLDKYYKRSKASNLRGMPCDPSW